MMAAICLTFGEQSENHVHMEKLGNGLALNGYSYEEMIKFKTRFETKKCETELICLNDYLSCADDSITKAYVLHIKNGIRKLNIDSDLLMETLEELDWDKKYFDTRRNKVLNKNARYNLCFSDYSRDPDYINKKGRIVGYDDVILLKILKKKILNLLDETDLECEGNYYYDIKKTGIGFHGDGERKKVLGINLCNPSKEKRELQWKWYLNSQIVSETCIIELEHGDMYIMSEKATGFDWKCRNIYTLRHGAGIKDSRYLK